MLHALFTTKHLVSEMFEFNGQRVSAASREVRSLSASLCLFLTEIYSEIVKILGHQLGILSDYLHSDAFHQTTPLNKHEWKMKKVSRSENVCTEKREIKTCKINKKANGHKAQKFEERKTSEKSFSSLAIYHQYNLRFYFVFHIFLPLTSKSSIIFCFSF